MDLTSKFVTLASLRHYLLLAYCYPILFTIYFIIRNNDKSRPACRLVPGRLARMTAKGRHPAGSRRSALLPVARRQDEVRSGTDAMVSRYGRLALCHVRHLTLAEGSLVTRLLQRRRSTRGRGASHRRQGTQKGPVGLPSGRAVRQDTSMTRRSRVRLRQGSPPGRRGDFFYGVLVLVAVADLGRRGRHCRRGAGRHRRSVAGRHRRTRRDRVVATVEE